MADYDIHIRIIGDEPFHAMRFNLIGDVLIIPKNDWTMATVEELLVLNQIYGLSYDNNQWNFTQFGDW